MEQALHACNPMQPVCKRLQNSELNRPETVAVQATFSPLNSLTSACQLASRKKEDAAFVINGATVNLEQSKLGSCREKGWHVWWHIAS